MRSFTKDIEFVNPSGKGTGKLSKTDFDKEVDKAMGETGRNQPEYNRKPIQPKGYEKMEINEDGGEGVFDCLLSYTNEYISITVTYDIISPYIPKGIIPFATDPFGNKICFDFRNDKHSPTIVFYDSDECDEQAIEYICSTFTNLIDSLHFSENE